MTAVAIRNRPAVRYIPLQTIRRTALNPRPALRADADLDALAASIGDENDSMMAQLPVVEELAPGEYHLLIGERRLNAAARRNWQEIACIVRPALDPIQAHQLRLVENLHRQPLHPLDQAAALKVLWLAANADALGLGDEARSILAGDTPLAGCLLALAELLRGAGFTPTAPAVTWDEVLDTMGVSMSPAERKRMLRVLSLEPEAQEAVRDVPITEAALRAVGTLDAEAQKKLAGEIAVDPRLAKKARAIANNVKTRGYTLEEAIAQAQGRPVAMSAPGPANGDGAMRETPEVRRRGPPVVGVADGEGAMADAAVAVMNARDGLLAALAQLRSAGGLAALSETWSAFAGEAITQMKSELERMVE